ncbi:MAG: ferredoxin [Actinobacteria bacterium]|nr:ferredoxin [Actinomycetota bacterium]
MGEKISDIRVDKDLCTSCGNCIEIAPEVFEYDEDELSQVKNKAGADDETILEAAKSCPSDAIIVIGEDGKQIWP